MEPSAHRLLGHRLDARYELVALVGRGAMADVFRGRDLERGTEVAIKVVPAELVASPVAAARFQREVKASSKLDHPAIVRVHAWGLDEDHGYIVMDLVEGEDLYDVIQRRGVLPVKEAIGLAIQVLGGLEAAHAAGVIHRDLKPENLMLSPDGQARILDFGIAKLHPTGSRDEETIPGSLTQVGTAVGTPSHMAPEQARGGQVDGRADLYAVGVLLYEMVTGRLPFEGKSPIELVMKQVRDLPTPPRLHNPAIPETLEAVILRALEKDPVARPRNAVAMRQALEGILAGLEDDDLDMPTQTTERAPLVDSVGGQEAEASSAPSEGAEPPPGTSAGSVEPAPGTSAGSVEPTPGTSAGSVEPAPGTSAGSVDTTPGAFDDPETSTADGDTVRQRARRPGGDTATLEGDALHEMTVTWPDPPRSDEATAVLELPMLASSPTALGPSGTIVDPSDDAGIRALRRELAPYADDEATQIAAVPAPRAEGSGRSEDTAPPLAPQGMPSIHAWTSASTDERQGPRSELDALLRQLPPPRFGVWRTVALAVAVVVSFGALLWALVT